jgi:phage shock protein E
MNWNILLVMAVVLGLFVVITKAGQIPAKDAAKYLKQGALVIDVRTPGEFNAGHLTNTINVPLDEIEAVVPARVKNKSQVLLLHCASGMRSEVAQKKLNGLGYTNAFNLGSYDRAAAILKGAD